jgi:hypothetical protein
MSMKGKKLFAEMSRQVQRTEITMKSDKWAERPAKGKRTAKSDPPGY